MTATRRYEGATLFVGDGTVIENSTFTVTGGFFEHVGVAATAGDAVVEDVQDLTGKFVIPAIVNPHGHIGYLRDADSSPDHFSRQNVIDHLRRLAYFGISAFQSLGTDRDNVELTIRDQQLSDARPDDLDEPLPLLLSGGRGIVAPTPGETNGGPYFAADILREVSGVDSARAAVRALAADHPDVVKIWVDDRNCTKSKLSPDEYRVVIDEAHALGLPVIAHIFELEDAKGVVRAGVDGIAHMVRNPGPDAELLDLMLERDVFAFTSMGIQTGVLDADWTTEPWVVDAVSPAALESIRSLAASWPDDMRRNMRDEYLRIQEGMMRMHETGVRVLLSADTGLLSQFFGVAEHREMEAMADAGMAPCDVLQASTRLPAEMLGLTDQGRVARGSRADFIVLADDPLVDIRNTRSIEAVRIGGEAVRRTDIRRSWTS